MPLFTVSEIILIAKKSQFLASNDIIDQCSWLFSLIKSVLMSLSRDVLDINAVFLHAEIDIFKLSTILFSNGKLLFFFRY